ncbi:hypothetical protein [Nonomuraea sp. NEAU-A123]|uniref:hypothetical protein n=1 Tax=Nonomuraea sp. NEAU-A123 TaxID=2839649 RepID=UPI001BE3EA28|nr:hypothetical protein [Nonomuraea sp. NEAU-A123]MBT2229393.1 hypothetical protein [Nonomuraea sp. NEAU-A123]
MADVGWVGLCKVTMIGSGGVGGLCWATQERPSEPGQDAIAACTSLLLAARKCSPVLSRLLLRELDRHLTAVESTPYDSTTARGDALIGALILTNTLSVPQAADFDRAERLASRLDDLLKRLEITDLPSARRLSVTESGEGLARTIKASGQQKSWPQAMRSRADVLATDRPDGMIRGWIRCWKR